MSANLETLLIETTVFNPFIGTGAFSFDFASAIFHNISGPGSNFGQSWLVTNMSSWAQGQVGVQYDYTASVSTSGPDDLPEPSTLGLIGLGLLGLGAMSN
jgi:hypothetical protein